MVKKGFLRTMEAALAIILTLIAVAVLSINPSLIAQHEQADDVLVVLMQSDSFVNCALDGDEGCVYDEVDLFLADKYTFNVSVSGDPRYVLTVPNNIEVFTDSVFVAGNTTDYKPTIVRMYYWVKK